MALPPGTTGMQLISSDYMVNAGQELYQCQRLTVNQDLYIVQITPVSPLGVHHEVLAIVPPGTPDGVQQCQSFLPGWTPLFASGVGSPSLTMPPNVALKISAGQQIVLNLHLFNAGMNPIPMSTAAIDIAVATNPANYQLAGVPFVGNMMFTIGANLTVNGQCTLSNDAQYFAVFPHMHLTGAHMKVWTEGSVAQTVWDEDYTFTEQKFGQWMPIQMKSGDIIKNTCTYSSAGLGKKFGESTTDEMCFAISYVTPPIQTQLGQGFCIF
jgi:hypothetical protein